MFYIPNRYNYFIVRTLTSIIALKESYIKLLILTTTYFLVESKGSIASLLTRLLK